MNYNEKILEDKNYLDVCNIILSLSKNENVSNILKDILYNGCVGTYQFKSSISCRNNSRIEESRRISMAYLLLNDYDTFCYFKDNNINLFHGTNANALASIIENGLASVDYLNSSGISVNTGEEWSRINGERSFISFSDVFDVSQGYSFIGEDGDVFPVVVGTSVDQVSSSRIITVHSDIPEIGIDGSLSVSNIKCICVPPDKVSFVKRMVGDKKIEVLSMSNIDKKFYYFDMDFMLNFSEKAFDEYLKFMESTTSFNDKDVYGVAKSRKLSNISKVIKKLKGIFFDYDEASVKRVGDEHVK